MASLLWFLLVCGLPADETPSFFIETIEITGVRFTGRGVLLSQARLKEQTRYREDVLRSAVVRIKQLPFVRQVSFSLKRGSERGRYRLVIRVEENSLFFFDLDYHRDYEEGEDPSEDTGYHGGIRYFLGRGGMAYATFFPEIDKYIGGYSHFDLARRGIFFNLELNYVEPVLEVMDEGFIRNEEDLKVSLALAIPVHRNQWVRLEGTRSNLKTTLMLNLGPGREVQLDRRDLSNFTELFWEHNTTDGSLFPSLGNTYRLGLGQGVFDLEDTRDFFGDVLMREERSVSNRAFLEAAWYFPKGFGHVWNANLTANSRFSDEDQGETKKRDFAWTGTIGYRYQWLNGSVANQWGDLYSGVSARYAYSRNKTTGGRDNPSFSAESYRIEAFLVHRSRWGVLRGSLRYDWRHSSALGTLLGETP